MTNSQPFTTTLSKIRDHSPCYNGWKKLLKTLGKTAEDDEPLSLLTILNSNGLEDALWCFNSIDGHDQDFRLFSVWCARQVRHLITDERSLNALDVAEQFAKGLATDDELAASSVAVSEAVNVAANKAISEAVSVAASEAAWAATIAVSVAVSEAVSVAASEAAKAAAIAVSVAASEAAWDAASEAAKAAARAKQEGRLRQMIADGKWIGSTQPKGNN